MIIQLTTRSYSALALFCMLVPIEAHSLQFWPSETEWSTWPEYCRVRYTETQAARGTDYKDRYSHSDRAYWESQFGDAWFALHHYCAGLLRVSRADAESSSVKRDRGYRDAIKSFRYTIERTPPEHSMTAVMQTQIALVQWKLNDTSDALRTLDSVIAQHPKSADAYFAKAKIFRTDGKLNEAREILQQGTVSTAGQSVELVYFLGLVNFELGDFQAAREFARDAYAAGYPLPGLREKLETAGYPL